jgi:hypothetical protein
MTDIALFGAAGSMGTRISKSLRNDDEYNVLYVEAPESLQKLKERGDEPTAPEQAVQQADIVILAVPDKFIAQVASQIVPKVRPGTMIMTLDPAAAYAGVLPERSDVTYFVAHPSHPPVFNDETDMEARRDFFGAGKAKQSIVCALMQGPDEDYAKGEAVARAMWQPILRAHRVTVEQMAMLEPVMSETVCATCLSVVRESVEEGIRRGIPKEAAMDFILGHINVELAILFNQIDWQFSAGAQKAIAEAMKDIFQSDWKKVFEKDNIKASVTKIATPE